MIYQYLPNGTLIEVHESTTLAAASIKCDESTIRKATGTTRLAKGFSWKSEPLDDTEVKNLPKILILDIETAPMLVHAWSCKTRWIPPNMIIRKGFCLTMAAKWLYAKNTMSMKLTPQEAIKGDDKSLIEWAWALLDEADVIIAHNGINFDIKKLQGRFLNYGLPPTSSFQQIDTLKVARKEFLLDSNKLDEINKQLGIGRKIDTGGIKLWNDCVNGDPKALQKMEEYNVGDVDILEETYFAMRSWIKSHPNLGAYMNSVSPVCSTCGSKEITRIGNYMTNVSKFPEYRCMKCGSLVRGRKSELTKEDRDVLFIGEVR